MNDRAVRVLFLSVIAVVMAVSVCGAASPKHPIDIWYESQISGNKPEVEINRATMEAAHRWQAEVNKQYDLLMRRLVPENQRLLEESMNRWAVYRDAEFRALDGIVERQWGAHGGSLWTKVHLTNRMEFIRKRALELAAYIEGFGDDADYKIY